MKRKITQQVNKLFTILGMGGLNGTVSIAALAGLFKPENALMLSVLFIAGPGAVITSMLSEGVVKERMFVALIAGIMATIVVIFAAGPGTQLLSFLNLNVLKITGGIAVLLIGLIIMGIKIPENVPLGVVLLGFLLGGILR